MRRVFAGRNGAPLGVDLNNRTGQNHRIRGTVAFANDASPVGGQGAAVLCRTQRGQLVQYSVMRSLIGRQLCRDILL
jgi:hypothetical protein